MAKKDAAKELKSLKAEIAKARDAAGKILDKADALGELCETLLSAMPEPAAKNGKKPKAEPKQEPELEPAGA